MRLKVLSLFVAIQVLSFGVWHTYSRAEAAETSDLPEIPVHSASAMPATEAVALTEAAGHVVHFSSENMEEKRRFLNSIKKNQISVALSALPAEHAKTVNNITIDYDPAIRRGMGGNNRIILRGVNVGTAEMIAVMVHEVGHNVDYAYLEPQEKEIKSGFWDGRMPIYESDPSLDFYRISWQSDGIIRDDAQSEDFVSGYSASDCFEDFAESYTFYILHNKDFKRLAASSEALYAKYRFMKYEVFNGLEFDTGDGLVDLEDRPWDITALDYNFSEFLS